jgi:hypothetical protein
MWHFFGQYVMKNIFYVMIAEVLFFLCSVRLVTTERFLSDQKITTVRLVPSTTRISNCHAGVAVQLWMIAPTFFGNKWFVAIKFSHVPPSNLKDQITTVRLSKPSLAIFDQFMDRPNQISHVPPPNLDDRSEGSTNFSKTKEGSYL